MPGFLSGIFGKSIFETMDENERLIKVGGIVAWATRALPDKEEAFKRLRMGGEIYPELKDVFEGIAAVFEEATESMRKNLLPHKKSNHDEC